jgi:DNA repair protein SbcC/Rad50
MLPIRLNLRHFLSYQQASIDFEGLHTICICGSNGAGKSSLLEAITWALWGHSRAVHEDDLIHGSETEVKVDLIFQSHQQIYRVLRSHQRKQSTVLEFQVATIASQDNQDDRLGEAKKTLEFRSLTEKGLRSTQQRIIETLKLDYDTFINSSYLRQGRADEFMLKRPSERKQVLADLLKLDQYDRLAEKAKERVRQFNAQAQVLRERLREFDQELEQRDRLEQQWHKLQAEIQDLQQQQAQDQLQLETLRQAEQDHHRSLQHRSFLVDQIDRIGREKAECQRTLEGVQQELANLQPYLEQSQDIEAAYDHWQEIYEQEEILADKSIHFQALQQQRSQLQIEYDRQIQEFEIQLQKVITEKEQIQEQIYRLEIHLAQKPEIEEAVQQLQKAREKLNHFDQLQAQVIPLKHRQDQLRLELHKIQTHIQARLGELLPQLEHLQQIRIQIPQLEEELLKLNHDINALDQLQFYRSQLREKGQERKNFLERLQAHQRDYEDQLQEMEQYQAPLEPGSDCPLCGRPLDESHWEQVQHSQGAQRQELIDMLLVVQDQLKVSEREIQVLREEYRRVDQEISRYPILTEQRGKVQQQLLSAQQAQVHYEGLLAEFNQLDRCQILEQWDPRLQGELAQIENTLTALNYDDRSHGLVRGEVERWRWADLRHNELRSMEKELLKLQKKLPQLNQEISDLEMDKTNLEQGEIYQQIQEITIQIETLNYDFSNHDRLRQYLRSSSDIPLQYQALKQAQNQVPLLQDQIQALQAKTANYEGEYQDITDQLERLDQVLDSMPTVTLNSLQQKIQTDRQCLDEKLAALGRLEQTKLSLDRLSQQWEIKYQELKSCQYQAQLYTELMQAFGKNGLQTLLIENLLPQLETETNGILSRLTSHQLHVQFITKRSSRSVSQEKLIDTLDIRIADIRGTRPYETYSGGEAFRVNFAIRLALARILAQRSGSPLQLLIVDEGFGTQDEEGCDRLVAAINAIAQDFTCILMITHMPRFKEAFQTRLEVEKTPDGSQIRLVL